MASEIRVNQIQNRSGLGTVTFSDTGVIISGVTTISDLRTSGTSVVAAGTTAAPSISPTGDSNTGIFFPSADTIAFAEGGIEVARINSSGNLGIGTANPIEEVHLFNSQNSGTVVRVENPNTGIAANASFRAFADVANVNLNVYTSTRNTTGYGITQPSFGELSLITGNGFQIGTKNATPLILGTNDVERVRIDSSGRVGIGITNPGSALALASGQGITWGATNYPSINGSNTTNTLIFSTQATERVRIDGSGNLGIGTNNTLYRLQINSDTDNCRIRMEGRGMANGDYTILQVIGYGSTQPTIPRSAYFGTYKHAGILYPQPFIFLEEQDGGNAYLWIDNSALLRTSPTITNLGLAAGTVIGDQTSDERMKNILGEVPYGLEEIKNINPVRYSMKSEPDRERIGFIAQQVQPIVPESVYDTKDSIEDHEDEPTKLAMEYVALIPVLVNAVKELSAEVESLKSQLSSQTLP